MIDSTITYEFVKNLVLDKILNSCVNITDYANISPVFKQGYTDTGKIPHTGSQIMNDPGYVVNITSFVSRVTISDVQNKMYTFLSDIGIAYNLTDSISSNNFLNFIENMLSFYATHVCYATSQYSSEKILIFRSNNNSYQNKTNMELPKNLLMMDSVDFKKAIDVIINTMRQSIRYYPCQYIIKITY